MRLSVDSHLEITIHVSDGAVFAAGYGDGGSHERTAVVGVDHTTRDGLSLTPHAERQCQHTTRQ